MLALVGLASYVQREGAEGYVVRAERAGFDSVDVANDLGEELTQEQSATQETIPSVVNDESRNRYVSAVGAPLLDGYEPPSSQSPQGAGPSHLFDLYAQSPTRCGQFTQPKVADLDRDGKKEIVSVFRQVNSRACTPPAATPAVYAWDNKGNLKPGFPVPFPLLNKLNMEMDLSLVGVGDVSGDNNLEIVITTGTTDRDGGGVYIVSSTGQLLQQLEVAQGFSGEDWLHPVLADLDSDGKLEILAKDVVIRSIGPKGKQVYAWKGDGSTYPGWGPLILNDLPRNEKGFAEPAVVDFEANGIKTILLSVFVQSSATPFVIALNTDGTVKRRTFFPWTFIGPYVYVGDVDGDSDYEIVLSSASKIIVLDKNGKIKYQWAYFLPPGSQRIGGFTLADLNNDNTLEVITHDYQKWVYVTDYQGNMLPGFPRVIYEGNPRNPVLPCGVSPPEVPYCNVVDFGVADLDNDGYLDIYSIAIYNYRTGQINDHQYGFFALDRFGNAVPGYPYLLKNYPPQQLEGYSYSEIFSPTYADVNDDGLGDILVAKGWGAIEVFTTNTPYRSKVGFCSYAFTQYGFDLQNTKVVPKCLSVTPIKAVPIRNL